MVKKQQLVEKSYNNMFVCVCNNMFVSCAYQKKYFFKLNKCNGSNLPTGKRTSISSI